MKCNCLVDDLILAINTATRALSGKTAIAALEGIYLQAEDNRLSLTCSDLNICINTAGCFPIWYAGCRRERYSLRPLVKV